MPGSGVGGKPVRRMEVTPLGLALAAGVVLFLLPLTLLLVRRSGSHEPPREQPIVLPTVKGPVGRSEAVTSSNRLQAGQDELPFRVEGGPSPPDLAAEGSFYAQGGPKSEEDPVAIVRSLPRGIEIAVVWEGPSDERSIHRLLQNVSTGVRLEDAVTRGLALPDPGTEGGRRTGPPTSPNLACLLRNRAGYEVARLGTARAYRVDGCGAIELTPGTGMAGGAVETFGPFHLDAPHLVVLCTGAIHGALPGAEMTRAVRRASHVEDLARALVEAADLRGGTNGAAAALVFRERPGDVETEPSGGAEKGGPGTAPRGR